MNHKSHQISISLLISLTSRTLAASNGTCYSPDGVSVANITTNARPCINIPGVYSMCCNTEGNGDVCLENGLCQNGNNYYRDFCTDPTWTSPNCLPKDLCGDSAYVELTLCSDGSWCCGAENYSACCNVGLGFKLASNLVDFVANASGTSANPTVTVTATATNTAATSATNGKGVSTGAIVGVAVGLVVVAVFGSIGGFFTGLRRGKRLGANINHASMYSDTDTKAPILGHKMVVYETQGRPVVAELGENNQRGELG